MSAYPGPLEFACLYCQAAAGRGCITESARRRNPHRTRWERRASWLRSYGEFIVEVVTTEVRLGVTAGERYAATVYWLDPEKVTLLRRVGDGFNPRCNMHARDVEFAAMTAAPAMVGGTK